VAWFQPYTPTTATRWLRATLLVFAGIPLLSAPWDHPSAAVLAVPVLMSLVCAVAAGATLGGWHPGRWAWAGCLLASTVLITLADLATEDAAATGLVVFLVPSVLAAALLERRGAWVTSTWAAAGALIVCGRLLPFQQALTTWVTLAGVLALLTALLTRAAHHNHHLTAELRRQAAVDSLTGLVTRRVLDGALSAALHGAAAARGNGLLIIDLDHFKAVNDTYGHLVGDEALKHCGAVLAVSVGPAAVVSRLGGDELAALVPGATYDHVAALATAVVEGIRATPLHVTGQEPITLTVSVGAAHSPTNATSSEDLYRAADRALYVAKGAGRDQAHTASLDRSVVEVGAAAVTG